MNPFVLSDESINSYGLKVLTPGINLELFKRNPVMYYNHDRERGVIGKWTNLRMDGDRLIGTPTFDKGDDFAANIERKIKNGFIKAASIGIDDVVIDEQKTVVSCTLLECSICDIPSNGSALMLYVNNKPVKDKTEITKLMYNPKNENQMDSDLSPIRNFLQLSEGCTSDDILGAIKALKLGATPTEIIDRAVKDNIVEPYEKDGLLKLAATNEKSFTDYMENRKENKLQNRKNEGIALIDGAFSDGRIRSDKDGKLKEFWLQSYLANPELTKTALSLMNPPKRVMDFINPEKSESRAGWTLDDYRKKAPMELKNNPKLYRELLDRTKEQ